MEQPKIERTLRLIGLMTSPVDYTVEQLSEMLCTSQRSIYRYLDTFRDAGFVVFSKSKGVYKLGKETRGISDISELIHFSPEEATLVGQLLDSLHDRNPLKAELRRKMASVCNIGTVAESTITEQKANNITTLREAIGHHRQVRLIGYRSANSGIVANRHVEPFDFTTDYVGVWCVDIDDNNRVKQFNTSRFASVEVLADTWQHTDRHVRTSTDIFRIGGTERTSIEVRLGVRARNLLLEEYPLAKNCISPIDETHWRLQTSVCGFAGIGRFVLGLFDDVEVVSPESLKDYLRQKIRKMKI